MPVLPRAATGQQGPAEEVPDDGAGARGKEDGLQSKEERGRFKLIPKIQNIEQYSKYSILPSES